MIVVDTSVWIDHLVDRRLEQVQRLRAMILPGLIVGDLVPCEVLQGLASEKQASLVEAALRRFDVRAITGLHIASASAMNHYWSRQQSPVHAVQPAPAA